MLIEDSPSLDNIPLSTAYFNNLIELENKIGEPMKKPIYLKDRFNK